MQTAKFLFAASAVAAFTAFAPADTCTLYVPSKPGMELEYRNFTVKNKPDGGTRMKVISVKDGGSAIEVQAQPFDKKDKQLAPANYVYKCENGQFYVDMQNMVTSEQKSAFKDMEISVTADKLDIPADPSAGQKLKDGTMKMRGGSPDSPVSINLTMAITNRKVEAVQDITVPAGTFKAVKITYDMESKLMITTRMKIAEWYAKDIGLVRTETSDKKGELQSYMVLQSIK